MENNVVEDNIQQIIESDENEHDPTLNSTALGMELPFKRIELGDKEYTKFIKNCERLVRASPEYKDFISFVRESFNANVCALTNENFDETGDIEIHHYPLTLFDICQIVVDDKLMKEEKFSSFDVALEVIKLHFAMYVGIVPLTGTLHKKYHKGYLDIPVQAIIGNYKKILGIYDVDNELVSKINLAEQITHSPYQGGWLTNPNPNFSLENQDEDNDLDELDAKIQEYVMKNKG